MKSKLKRVRLGTNGYYSLSDTMECGQTFRWKKDAQGRFAIIAGENFCLAEQPNDHTLELLIEDKPNMEDFWSNYFNVGADYSEAQEICRGYGGTLAEMAEASKGIRLLNQEPWEMLISFIISQRNNIPKIQSTIERLCARVGNKVDSEAGYWYKFPTPSELLNVSSLDGVGLGYREPYILGAAEEVASGRLDLAKIEEMTYENAITTLEGLYGIGPKVANCIALFGYHKTEAFPIDVWIERAIGEYFDGSLDYGAFGKWAGIIQQYIFFYARNLNG